MKSNYYFQINEMQRSIILEPCNAFQAIRLYNFFANGIELLKESQGIKSICLYKIGETLPKRILL